MKFELSGIKNFKTVMIATEQFLQEIKLEADSDGIRFRGLDKSHIAFIGLNIEESYFDEYEIDEPENMIIDTSELIKVLKRAKNDDILTCTFTDDGLKLVFSNDNTKRTFTIRAIDMDYESPSMPNITYPVSLTVDYKTLNELLKDAELYDNKVKFHTKDYDLNLISKGDLGEYQSDIELMNSVGEYESIFGLDFLKNFFKINISKEININMGNDMPIFFELEDEFGLKVDFLLAPRIEEDI